MKHFRLFTVAFAISFSLVVVAISSVSPAQVLAGAASVYAQRRDRLAASIGENVAVILGAEVMRSDSQFRQSNEFYYFTGIHDTPGCLLILDGTTKQSLLLLPPLNSRREQWEGHQLSPGREAEQQTGIAATAPVSEFPARLPSVLGSRNVVYTPLSPEELAETSRDQAEVHLAARMAQPWDGRPSREAVFKTWLTGRGYEVKDLSPIIDEMRRVKSEDEIALIRKSCEIGVAGLVAAMRSCRPNLFEYQLAAVAEAEFKKQGAFGGAYFAIVGSGPNSCILHYSTLRRQIQGGDIIVMDYAPDYWYYASDITRTFPASGKFSEDQVKVYDVCLRAQKVAIAAVKPGATFAQVNAAARAVIDQAGLGRYWLHGTSHYVGMAVHDVGSYAKPFEPGVIITVEPGVYIPNLQLGVRIEDVVLVTQNGAEVLSSGAPREREEIEKIVGRSAVPAKQ